MKYSLLAVPLLISAGLQAQVPTPDGDEFQVNTYTTGYQKNPAVGMGSDGAFIVTWESGSRSQDGPDGDHASTQSRRYDSTGAPIGDEFQVNTYTHSWQKGADIAVAPNGNFLVVWESDGALSGDTDENSIQGQLFLANGSPMGGEFQINTFTHYDQSNPAVAAKHDGSFIVVWDSDGSASTDDWSRSIQAQRLDENGI